jgi:subtilisin-like proprotein convertase family protein
MYLTSAGGTDAYVMKLDPSGHLSWARSLGGVGDGDVGISIAVDGGGNVYTGGEFTDTVDFDPGPGSFPLTSAGDRDGFVSELDPSGNFIAAWRLGGAMLDARYIGITTYQDPVTLSRSVIVAGAYQGTSDFPTGASLTGAGSDDAFVMRLSPQLGAIAGNVFNDLNDNGANDEAAPLKGWTVFLDQNQNGVLDPGEVSTVTDSQGNYVFPNLAAGTYDIAVVGQLGYTPSAPAAGQAGTYTGTSNGQVGRTITLGTAQFADRLDFGEYTPSQAKTYSTSPSLKLVRNATISSTLTIALSYTIYDLNVQLNITQVDDTALQSVTLTAPDGTIVMLFDGGLSGSNLTTTTLDDAAAAPIALGTPPYAGTFRPLGVPMNSSGAVVGFAQLSAFDGKNLHGTWTLTVTEGIISGKNSLNSWSLLVTGPKPPGAAMSMRLTSAGDPSALSASRSVSNPVAPGIAVFDQALGMAAVDPTSGLTAPVAALGDMGLTPARSAIRWRPQPRRFGPLG